MVDKRVEESKRVMMVVAVHRGDGRWCYSVVAGVGPEVAAAI